MLTCGPPSVGTAVRKGKGDDGESSSDDGSGDEDNQTVSLQIL